ncbi:MAG: NifB/NifX family molybdenum-iron cluster-binding protein [Anaerolineae bacterium]|nr:NifB/NifX family molybdenum-iron cluster-binding protein [Anaerolineae bacterium]
MKIVITANGTTLDAPVSPIFGRCPTYLLVDTETMQVEILPNPALTAGGGAGVQAAQFIVEKGAQAVVAGNVGPNAFNVFQAANIPVYQFNAGTVLQAVEAYKAGQLLPTGQATGRSHVGMGQGLGRRGRG